MEIFDTVAPKTIWFFSDPHYDHVSLVSGSANHPEPARGRFRTADEMGEFMVEQHNALVRPRDHYYCLGDFSMDVKALARWAPRLHGHGRIILGNHDLAKAQLYLQFFKKVMAYREFDGMLFSHIPIAPWSMRWRANVHGHCHEAKPLFYEVSDPDLVGFGRRVRYINISMERIHYRPVSLEQISKWSRA